MTDDDRRINETIARACGWAEFTHGWAQTNLASIQLPDPPDYIADPARLPEMWALCTVKNYDAWVKTQLRLRPDDVAFMAGVQGRWYGSDDDPQRAFARALAAAIDSE
jgi:hypothetical protein